MLHVKVYDECGNHETVASFTDPTTAALVGHIYLQIARLEVVNSQTQVRTVTIKDETGMDRWNECMLLLK